MAPPAGLAKQKGAGGTFLQAVSATRTGAKRNTSDLLARRGRCSWQICFAKFAPVPRELCSLTAACCYASSSTEKKTKSRPRMRSAFCWVDPTILNLCYIKHPVNTTLLFSVSITVKEIILFPFVSSFNSAFSDADLTSLSICSS